MEQNNMEIEHILAAAIHFDDGKEYDFQPKNIKTGIVLCGYMHASIFPQIGGLVEERQNLGIYEKAQGFITSENRFLNRKEAAKLALITGQIDKVKYFGGKQLDSGDINTNMSPFSKIVQCESAYNLFEKGKSRCFVTLRHHIKEVEQIIKEIDQDEFEQYYPGEDWITVWNSTGDNDLIYNGKFDIDIEFLTEKCKEKGIDILVQSEDYWDEQ